MVRRWIALGTLILITVSLWLIDLWHPDIILKRGTDTAIALTIIYFFFKLLLEERFIRRLRDSKRRYFFNKTFSIAYFIVILVILLLIWVEDLQALLVGFGLVAAAVTIALQEVAKNFVGGLIIFVNGVYSVGDRVEIGAKKGDVIDIGLFYTTLLETNEWISGDQPTGRLSVIPNGQVLFNVVNNYTRDFNFIWDELVIPLTYDSDWRAARSLVVDVIKQETREIVEGALHEMPRLESKYFFTKRSTEPRVFLRITDNWVELSAIFITDPRERRIIRDRLSSRIMEGVEVSPNLKIASQTFDVVGFPEIRLKERET